jgi:hypothetical protein
LSRRVDSLRRPQTVKIVATIKTPYGLVSANEVAGCFKELISDQSKPRGTKAADLRGIIPACFEGYECLGAEPYTEPAAEQPAAASLGRIARPPAAPTGSTVPSAGGAIQSATGERKGQLKKAAWFGGSILATLVVEHLGVPVLHWVFSTLAYYVK